MTKADHDNIMRNIPHMLPVFRVIKVLDWARKDQMQIGDEIACTGRSYYVFRSGFRPVRTSDEIKSIGPEHLEFVEYLNCPELRNFI